MNNNEIIYCARCGAEMRADSRYCMKCGNLNYDHPENKNMEKVLAKNKVGTYEVGSGKFILDNNTFDSNKVVQSIANNTGSKAFAFYISFGLYIFINLTFLLKGILTSGATIDVVLAGGFPVCLIITSILFLFIYSFELLFMKANERWWAALVPVYNFMIMAKIAFKKKWLGLIVLIPIVGQIFLLVLFYKIGEKFKVSGLATAIFSIFMIPFIAYGHKTYDNRIFVETNEKNPVEKEYARKKVSVAVPILFTIIGIVLMVYSLMSSTNSSLKDFLNAYYVYAAEEMVEVVKKQSSEGTLVCDDVNINTSGFYYVHILDAGYDLGLKFSSLMEPIEGYVKVVNDGSGVKYYVSLTDGKKGFPETLSSEITNKSVVGYKSLKKEFSDNACEVMIEE